MRSGICSATLGLPSRWRTRRHRSNCQCIDGGNRSDGVLVAGRWRPADRHRSHRAVATHAELPLPEDLGPRRGVAVEQVGDSAGDGEAVRWSGPAVATGSTAVQPGTSTAPSSRTSSTAHVSRSTLHGSSPSSSPIAAAKKRPGYGIAMLAAMPKSLAMRRVSQSRTPAVGTATTKRAKGSPPGAARRSHQAGGERRQLRPVVDEQRHSCLDTKRVSHRNRSGRPSVHFGSWAACGPLSGRSAAQIDGAPTLRPRRAPEATRTRLAAAARRVAPARSACRTARARARPA